MIRSPHLFLTAAFALTLAAAPGVVRAQAVVQALPGTTDADRLADTMRELAANPRNVDALVRAGELSLGLGDLSGAAALFARAEKVDPRNGRMKAGMASILVRSERPGEALRYFSQAESFGLQPRYFAADRALAYDLIGQQDRAQRDYRVALRDAPDDETVRRYALSLGISGKRELALKQLEPLIAKTDRGAWRARAFILAMTDDVAGAETIATTMMPGTMAQGLLPFFRRLPALAPADRAFAVHFGEVSATPERIADARMVPALPFLGPDPTAPVMMAAVQPAAPVVDQKKGRKTKAAKPGRVEMAAAAPMPTTISTPTATVVPARAAPPVTLASVQPLPARTLAPSVASSVPTRTAPAVVAQPVLVAQTAPVPVPVPRAIAPTRSGELAPSVAAQMAAMPANPTAQSTVSRVGSTSVTTPAPVVVTPAAPPPVAAQPVAAQPVAVTPVPQRAVVASEDSILARIIASLSIPASELGVEPVVQPRPAAVVTATTPTFVVGAPEDGARVIAEAKAKAERDAAARKILASKLAAEKKAADRKAVADKKALAEKKAAAAEKALADKEAAEEKRIARANPPRIWVQVSTGATEGDLPKAWRGVKAKAPAAFGSRGGWTTPWRATNRVLAGPFKTDAEARTFVNQLAKEGVSTFSFTSDPGQIITKLPAK